MDIQYAKGEIIAPAARPPRRPMWNTGRRNQANECFGAYHLLSGGGYYRLLGIWQTVKGAIKCVRIYGERGWITRKPLTLKQLKELGTIAGNGKNIVVYCTPLNELCKVFKYGIMFFGTEEYRSWAEIEETYAEKWLAYMYHYAHIDREKWEPCDVCSNAKHIVGLALAIMDDGSDHRVDTKMNCEYSFCPNCGRPLTDEAWAELERRVCGEV